MTLVKKAFSVSYTGFRKNRNNEYALQNMFENWEKKSKKWKSNRSYIPSRHLTAQS